MEAIGAAEQNPGEAYQGTPDEIQDMNINDRKEVTESSQSSVAGESDQKQPAGSAGPASPSTSSIEGKTGDDDNQEQPKKEAPPIVEMIDHETTEAMEAEQKETATQEMAHKDELVATKPVEPQASREQESAETVESNQPRKPRFKAAAAAARPGKTPVAHEPASPGQSPSPTPPQQKHKLTFQERLQKYKDVIEASVVDLDTVKKLASYGIPDSRGLRATYWKLCLNYLPEQRDKWEATLENRRNLYKSFVEELVIDPHEEEDINHDHPLNVGSESKWDRYHKDNEIRQEIDKDVRRTLPDLHFFNNLEDQPTEHHQSLLRILFIYAKLNPGIQYVQGMNEVLAPVYYIFATDPPETSKENLEADAFFCFTNIMSSIRDHFCSALDKSNDGIQAKMKHLNRILKEQDYELWAHLEKENMNPQFYSFRWITLLLTQEFELPDVLRLYDSLFSQPLEDQFEYLYYVCCAMLLNVREQVLGFTFPDILKLLQHYPPTDITMLLKSADSMYCRVRT